MKKSGFLANSESVIFVTMLAHVHIDDTPLHDAHHKAPPLHDAHLKAPPLNDTHLKATPLHDAPMKATHLKATPLFEAQAYPRSASPKIERREDLVVHGHPGLVAAPGEWVRALGNMEMFMQIGGEYGSLNTVQALWLSSTAPIRPEDVRDAVNAVAEKNHVLQLCVVWRGVRAWFRRMEQLVVDFAVESQDAMSAFYALLQMKYNFAQGPLWRARLVPSLQKSADGRHEAVLIVSAHHCITDGLTNMLICRDIMHVLNATMTGAMYDVPTRTVIPAISDSLHARTDWWYSLKYFWKKLYGTFIRDYGSKLYFRGILPQPSTDEAATRILHEQLTADNTKKLVQRCREAGVTVHSCVSAIAYVAMFRVAQQRVKGKLDEAVVNLSNCVNMRRYFNPANKESPGCHIALEEKEFLVRSSDGATRDNFWAFAKRVHEHLHNSLNVEHYPIKNCSVYIPLAFIMCANHELTRRARKNLTDCHVITTNMGNLQHLLPSHYGDGPVEITSLLRSVSSELVGHPCTLTFHTFRGRFMISLDYFTNKMTDDVASQYFSNMTGYINNLIAVGAIERQVA